MVKVRIEAEGPQAQAALDEAAAFFEREFGVKAETQAIEPEGTRKGDAVAWIAMLLTIPPAILATIQLEEKLKLIERTDELLTALRARLGKAAATIRIGAQQHCDVVTVKARELVDELIEAARQDKDEDK